MRALIKNNFSNSFLTIGSKQDPILSDDQLLIKVEAFSLNRADYLYLNMPEIDWTVGIDFVGTVIKSNSIIEDIPIGSRVMAHSPIGGGGAELASVNVNNVIKLPSNIDISTAAALPLSGLMALRMLREAKIKSGQNILITGATGGVGAITAELAIQAGVNVTVLTRDISTATYLRELGADIVSSLDNLSKQFDVVFESVGGEIIAKAIKNLKRNGLILWFGQASGQPAQLDFFSLFGGHESMTLKHFVYNDLPDIDDKADLSELLKLVSDDKLHLDIEVNNWSETGKN